MGAVRKARTRVRDRTPASWREKVLAAAREFYERDIVDGTPEGNQVIGSEIIGGATGHPDPDYRNRKTAWCGFFVQCCFRKAGFNRALTLASAGKVLHPYGRYRSKALKGAPDWALDTRTGEIERIENLHRRVGKIRTVTELPGPVTPGDIVLHRKKKSWNGHVMLVESVDEDAGTVTVIEGNSMKTVGPDGRQRDGVGMRTFDLDDPYLACAVSPSDLDFDPVYRYFATRKRAEKASTKLQAEGAGNG